MTRNPSHPANAIGCRFDVDQVRVHAKHPSRESIKEQRVAQGETARALCQRLDVGKMESDYYARQRDHHARPRTGSADIKHHPAGLRHLAQTDERAERPDKEHRGKRRRNKVGQAGFTPLRRAVT